MSSFDLKIRPTSAAARIQVLDAFDRIVEGSIYGARTLNLKRGLYTVRAEHGGSSTQTTIVLTANQELELTTPMRVSAAPLTGTKLTHEFHEGPSAELSHVDTAPAVGNASKATGRLFLFLRDPHTRVGGVELARNLRIERRDGGVAADLDATDTEGNDGEGWLAFSAPAEPGYYRLKYDGETPRVIPVHVFEGWETQLFAAANPQPRMDTLTVFMARRGEGFHPGRETEHATDLALQGLQNGDDWMPREAMQELLGGKFDNPMLGLLGAHILLMRRDPKKSLVRTVLRNLGRLIGDAPDVRALELLAHQRLELDWNRTTFEEPPMIRAGLDAVVRETVLFPYVLADYAEMDEVVTELMVDSPWTTWRLDIEKEEAASTLGLVAAIEDLEPTWVDLGVRDWVANAGRGGRAVNEGSIALALGVSRRMVVKSLRRQQRLDFPPMREVATGPEDEASGFGRRAAIERYVRRSGLRVAGDLHAELDKKIIAMLDRAMERARGNKRNVIRAIDMEKRAAMNKEERDSRKRHRQG